MGGKEVMKIKNKETIKHTYIMMVFTQSAL